MKNEKTAKTEKNEKQWERVTQEFAPVCDADCRVLILGTAPSKKSREVGFYYGHPQNRFWKVLANLTGCEVPGTVEEKNVFLLREHIAVWDVIAKCDIIGSSDSSIRNVVPADLSRILDHAPIRQIYANGGKAYELYQKYAYPITGREIVKLPSTSPANAAWQMERLLEAWAAVKENLG